MKILNSAVTKQCLLKQALSVLSGNNSIHYHTETSKPLHIKSSSIVKCQLCGTRYMNELIPKSPDQTKINTGEQQRIILAEIDKKSKDK